MDCVLSFPEALPIDPAVDRWLEGLPPAMAGLARPWVQSWRGRASVTELMHDGQATACLFGGAFLYVAAHRNHVNLGFFLGSRLADPHALLVGTGKVGRHHKLRPGQPQAEEALRALVDAAYEDMAKRLGSPKHEPSRGV